MGDLVFISENSYEPYQKLDSLSIDMYIQLKEGYVTGTKSDLLFLVAKHGSSFSRIKIKPSGLTSSNIDFKISKADVVGNPIQWADLIIYDNIEYPNNVDLVIPFVYQAVVVDNIYILEAQVCSVDLDVYVED